MKKSKKLKYNHIAMLADSTDEQSLSGTVFYKQIVKYGKWINPMMPIEFMELDAEFGQSIVDNFNAGVIDRVPVPLDHTDATEANTGEVIKLELKEDGIYAYLDIRRPNVVEDINNGLIFDVSISFDWDYVDTANGDHHGPTLFHVALVNNPYLKGMPEFETAQVGSYSEGWGKLQTALALPQSSSVIMLSESKVKELNNNMENVTVKNDKEYEVTITVKNEEGEEVSKVLKAGEETDVPKDQSEAVLTQITEAVDPEAETEEEKAEREKKEKEAEDAKGGDGDGDGDKDLSDDERKELSELRKSQALSRTKDQYQTLLSAGKITPAQEEAFMQLSEVQGQTVQLSADKKVSLSELVTQILSAGPQVLNMSENGSGKEGDGEGEGEGSGDADKKPSESLSTEESKGMQAVGADPKRMDELAEKYPAMQSSLEQSNKQSKEDK